MKKKQLSSLLTAAALALSLAACGGGESAGGTGTGGEAPGGSQTFSIGSIGPTTGPNALYGQAVVNGAELAVQEINASDSAIKFEFRGADDEGDGEKSVNAYNKLMDWGMQILVGPTTTGASMAVSEVAYGDRTFMLTPSASAVEVTEGKDNVFQVCFTDPNQGIASAGYMAAQMPGAKIAVIYRNDDAYSQGIRDAFVAEAGDKGLDIVYQGTFTEDTKSDFSVQLTAAQTAGADTVFLPIYYEPAAVIFNQAKNMNYAPTFFGVDGMDGILTMPGFTPALAEGVMLLTPFSADAPESRPFVDAYTAAYGSAPNQFAADAYDAVYIVRQALEAAGCTGDMTAAEICEALVGAMRSLSFSGLTGQDMTWDESGAVSKPPVAYVIRDGKYAAG